MIYMVLNNMLCAIRHVWKMHIVLKCDSPFCPKSSNCSRYPTTYSLHASSSHSFVEQINELFPSNGDSHGYCGSEFHVDPPDAAPCCINDKQDVNTNERVMYHECRGTNIVQSAEFLSKSPWVLPFVISNFKSDRIQKNVDNPPNEIYVYQQTYKLAGWSMHCNGHFTAIVNWRFSYDGLGKTDKLRFHLESDNDYLNQEGSFAFYILL